MGKLNTMAEINIAEFKFNTENIQRELSEAKTKIIEIKKLIDDFNEEYKTFTIKIDFSFSYDIDISNK